MHPSPPDLLGKVPWAYHGSVLQSEWASAFWVHRPEDGERGPAPVVRPGVLHGRSADVLRFGGQKVPATGAVQGHFAGAVTTAFKRRPEGVCLRHAVNGNAIKTSSGPGFIRVETTLNHPHDFKVSRTKENEPTGEPAWRRLRQGVADLHRRAPVCQAAKDR